MAANHDNITFSVRDLAIGYSLKKEKALIASNINFDTIKGELTAIIGINGIGKSTLLRTLGKVQPKLSGVVELNGKSLDNYKPIELAADLSLVLTEPIASKNMTVAELLALGRSPYTNWLGALSKEDVLKVEDAIQQMELAKIQHKKCYELSDGQLQRVMIARALVQDTAVILLDEPTTHLDLYHKVQILKLLKSIAHRTNKTIVFTTHEIEIAIQICDKILVLDGTVNAFDKPNKLIEQKAFDTLFPSDTVFFDAQNGSFKIKE
ncbi:ABC transporter ATP-binding protein [Aurantibacter crassamenti]|uniref:ABC transporter ATP-binding protein n=1 Tax=Aurantibacter crassamenti TaxID=1837375 RepID=UPI00193938B4|nr:ABC transporter ATP-binding protein [Aurantibacter crassamenti]MBM1107582.1 ABC transporter ATP-binding protein [Aurantibacter crassamenti]